MDDYKIKIANSATKFSNLSENLTCYELTHKRNSPCEAPEHICPLKEMKKTKKPVITEHIHYDKEGNCINVEVHSYPIFDNQGNIIQAIEYCLDITERKRAEEALRESEESLRTLINATPDIICFKDTEGRWIEANDAILQLFELERQNYKGKKNLEIAEFNNFYKDVFLICEYTDEIAWKKGTLSQIEEIISLPDGTLKIYDVIKVPLFYPDGKRKGIVVLGRDITERKQAEEALLSEREHLDVTLRSIGDGVITTDIEGKIILINKIAEELTGWTQIEAIGRPLNKIFYIINEKTSEQCENPVELVLKTGEIIKISNNAILIAKDGTRRMISDSGAPIKDKNGKTIGVVLVFRDVTGKRKMEEELQKIDKLESIGILAGGIAHDFNNILTAISDNIALIKIYVEKDSKDKIFEVIKRGEKAIVRAKNLTQQLLTFSKGGVPIKKAASISDLLIDTIEFALSGSNIKCQFSLIDNLWLAQIDEAQISQVINNLIINAKQATHKAGIIEVKTENVIIDVKEILPIEKGKYIKISIKDTGEGISKENLPKIFDPYFTTKEGGNGLGLATTFSIIKKHNGYIIPKSKLGEGTTFDIYLPFYKENIAIKIEKTEEILTGKGKILLMDDDIIILEATIELLEELGYKVEFAKVGAEAIELYKNAKKSAEPFDVIIMDLTIPGGMGGKETIQKLILLDPEVKAIVSSGYSRDPIMADFKKYGFSGVVSKPYKIEELFKILYEIIKED